jgi:hypothetical protein
LTHPFLRHPPTPGLHTLRVHYPGAPLRAAGPRTHVLPPDPDPGALRRVLTALVTEDD